MSNASSSAFFPDEGGVDIPHSANTSCYRCKFDEVYYEDALFTRHQIKYASFLSQAVVKRKAEFLAGRYAAQQAIKRREVEQTTVEIGYCRSPIWPIGLVGSITHTTTQAICAVARNTDYRSVGIDLADLISLATANEIKSHIIQIHETDAFSQLPLTFEQSLTLAFSAKESVFKALYPQVGAYFEFHAAEISEVKMKDHTFLIRLTRNLTDTLVKGTAFRGSFKMQSDMVFTSIFVKQRPEFASEQRQNFPS